MRSVAIHFVYDIQCHQEHHQSALLQVRLHGGGHSYPHHDSHSRSSDTSQYFNGRFQNHHRRDDHCDEHLQMNNSTQCENTNQRQNDLIPSPPNEFNDSYYFDNIELELVVCYDYDGKNNNDLKKRIIQTDDCPCNEDIEIQYSKTDFLSHDYYECDSYNFELDAAAKVNDEAAQSGYMSPASSEEQDRKFRIKNNVNDDSNNNSGYVSSISDDMWEEDDDDDEEQSLQNENLEPDFHCTHYISNIESLATATTTVNYRHVKNTLGKEKSHGDIENGINRMMIKEKNISDDNILFSKKSHCNLILVYFGCSSF